MFGGSSFVITNLGDADVGQARGGHASSLRVSQQGEAVGAGRQ